MFDKFIDKIAVVSQKLASQVHLRSLRDSFIIAIPFLVLAGIIIVLNFVVLDPNGIFKSIIEPATMLDLRDLGTRILNGTMNILSVMLAILVAFNLATKKGVDSPIIPAMVSLGCFFTLMPTTWSVIPNEADLAVLVDGMVPYHLLNANGVFLAIVTAFISTEVFIRISNSKRLKINLGDEIPPMVAQTFEALFAIMLTIGGYAVFAYLIKEITDLEVYELIQHAIQAPLVHLTTGLPGFMGLGFMANLLFALGIHPSGIVNPILEPPLLVAMSENMAAFAAGQVPPHIIVLPFRDLYGHLGGTGSTLALLIAILIRSKMESHKKFAKTVVTPGLFNINEPVIFGFPIVMNPMLIIPFVFYPMINYVIAYYATALELVGRIVAYTPWSVPPLMSGYLASGGDYRNVILQALLLALGVVCYLPFLIAYERGLMMKKSNELATEMANATIVNTTNEAQPVEQASTEEATVEVAQDQEADVASDSNEDPLTDKTIILVCNEGMSTSMMAKRMEKYTKGLDLNTRIYAINSGRFESEYMKADMVLLGPQLAYMKNEFQEKTGNSLPIEPILPEHFAKMDGEGAVNFVRNFIK